MASDSLPGTTRFILNQRPRFTRASNPKVRTGCATCRNRRKKCDEGKPACATCLKYQGYCPGYPASKTQPTAIAQNSRPLLPKLAAAADRAECDGLMTRRPKYASFVFSDQLERDHFEYWRSFVDSSALFHCELLSRIVPQLSWNDPAVRHATLAIGAAVFSNTTREQRILGKGDAHLAALSHYGKALRLLNSVPVSPERSLFMCILFMAFECVRGRTAAALVHINYGVRVIEHLHHQRGDPLVSLPATLIDGFRHLNFQLWALNGVRLQETRERVPWCCRGRRARYAVEEMPAAFETLDWANWWWNQVRHHVEHRAPLYNNFQVKGSSPSGKAAAVDQPPRGYDSPESARRIRTFMRYLDAWAAAFAPLAMSAEASRAANLAEYLKALDLRIHYLCLWIGVRSAGWTDAAETARLTPAFRDIATLSRRFLTEQAAQRQSGPGGGEVFTIEDGLTWPLASSYRLCASPDVRREIVRLFREYPRRDSLLDTHAFLVMMEWTDKAASAGIIGGEEQSPATERVVFDGDAVVLQKQLWDSEASRWRKKNIRLSIL
ncbi:uncharacterized protein GLRG_05911 [Colletotrichum graminicola M1.001]|uniref:Zn(2)-C6 fungal-type domain-containing protein n=1 Tax=Colletotrichum graminicola (strain M1.001 / M2 / FGSC 10212) TaxID=645133 RepID=E3QIS9_COLGM|nr:uncharacterized protein GLRG_05911 [Colletotrichum graminicola M1.001]EFQ30767.1 hypothetical protein GLRG_05911 [Colletotrichum graminicola M1.001]